MVARPILLHPGCEVCGKTKNMKEHYPNFVPYPGALRLPNREWHRFVPHVKHRMQLDKAGYGYIKGRRLYFFKCVICQYEHPVAVEDFHGMNRAPSLDDRWHDLQRTFDRVQEAYAALFTRPRG